MRKSIAVRSIVVAGLIAFGLGGCETPAPKPVFPDLTYGHMPVFSLDVARIEIEQTYRAPAARPNVDHLFPVKPGTAAVRWLRDRLQAVGSARTAVATVQRAAVVEVPLKKTPGVRGSFTVDQSERYDAALEVQIRIIANNGHQEAVISVQVERSRTVPEDITIDGRQRVWFEMTEAMMNDLNAQLERQIRTHFTKYLR